MVRDMLKIRAIVYKGAEREEPILRDEGDLIDRSMIYSLY